MLYPSYPLGEALTCSFMYSHQGALDLMDLAATGPAADGVDSKRSKVSLSLSLDYLVMSSPHELPYPLSIVMLS